MYGGHAESVGALPRDCRGRGLLTACSHSRYITQVSYDNKYNSHAASTSNVQVLVAIYMYTLCATCNQAARRDPCYLSIFTCKAKICVLCIHTCPVPTVVASMSTPHCRGSSQRWLEDVEKRARGSTLLAISVNFCRGCGSRRAGVKL